ncbi:MFS transporter [Gluconacetobacter sp.]|uniref:MFS transporter n=1 Tax=Gluconacetobacter sp. TaxID=1935994 RepID=UPI0039ED3825
MAVSRRTRIAYSAAHGGKSLIWHADEVLTFPLLTAIAGLSAHAAAIVFAIWFAVGAFAGYGFGRFDDRRQAPVPLFARAFCLTILFCALLLEALSHAPIPLLLATGLLLHLVYAWLDAQANSLISRLSASEADRHSLSRWRSASGVLANIAVTFVLMQFMASHDDTLRWPLMVTAVGLAATSLAGMAGFLWLPHGPALMTAPATPPASATVLPVPWKGLFVLFLLAIMDNAATQAIIRHAVDAGATNAYILRMAGELCGITATVLVDRWTQGRVVGMLGIPAAILLSATAIHASASSVAGMDIPLSFAFVIGLGHGMNVVGFWAAVAAWSPAHRQAETAGAATLLFRLALSLANLATFLTV